MEFNEYIKNATKTESVIPHIVTHGNKMFSSRILHAAMGMVTESVEFLDECKKCIFYGKPPDETNMMEELGDLMWYVAILCDELDINIHEILNTNITKLKARYPDKFTTLRALDRNLEKERKILEDGRRMGRKRKASKRT